MESRRASAADSAGRETLWRAASTARSWRVRLIVVMRDGVGTSTEEAMMRHAVDQKEEQNREEHQKQRLDHAEPRRFPCRAARSMTRDPMTRDPMARDPVARVHRPGVPEPHYCHALPSFQREKLQQTRAPSRPLCGAVCATGEKPSADFNEANRVAARVHDLVVERILELTATATK